jgi:beta-lactamase class A
MAGSVAAVLPGTAWPQDFAPFSGLVAKVGGRVGVAALDLASGRRLEHRAHERFAMCSTFKWVLAGAVLRAADQGKLTLQQAVKYSAADLLSYAPVAKDNVAKGSLPVETLAKAAVEVSDNTAANLLLALIGGPAGLTDFMRETGDSATRLDRNEPALNSNIPGDPRDTTTPNAMVGLMQSVLAGDVLAQTSREKLLGWMKASPTGLTRIRAGLPQGWQAGDKSGTGTNGAVNDVAIAWPPGRAPILMAVYLSESQADTEALSAVHADIARAVVAAFI